MISKEILSKIVELANSIPDEYRQKCFELLLSHTLRTSEPKAGNKKPDEIASPATPSHISRQPKPFVLPIDVKAFLTQYKLDESILWKYFLVEGDVVRPIYHLKTTKKATAEIQHALMISLENALIGGKFQVDMETLRTRCLDHNCYDKTNFNKNLKDNADLFRSVTTDAPLVLSTNGKAELADILEQLKV